MDFLIGGLLAIILVMSSCNCDGLCDEGYTAINCFGKHSRVWTNEFNKGFQPDEKKD